VRITTANVTLQREVRALTAERGRLTKRLAAARDNARFADKRIAALEAQIAELLTAPPS
jgi:predicted  nucleic acid-binding Zn-ribbon protein